MENDIENTSNTDRFAMYLPKPKFCGKFIPINEASIDTGVSVSDLIGYGADGVISLCIPIRNSEIELWIIGTHQLKLEDPKTEYLTREAYHLNMRMHEFSAICRDMHGTQWLTLGQDDCRSLLVAGSHYQYIFESGWMRHAETSKAISSYPYYHHPSGQFHYVPLCHNVAAWRFVTHKKKVFSLEESMNPTPGERYDITISIENILVPDFELNNLQQKYLFKDRIVRLEKNELIKNLQSSKLKHVIMAAEYFWHRIKKYQVNKYPSSTEISKFLQGKHEESFKSQKAMKATPAAHAARIMRHVNLTKESLSNSDADAFISPKLKILIKAHRGEWYDAGTRDNLSWNRDRVVAYLVENGFTTDEAEAGATLSKPDKPLKTATPQNNNAPANSDK